MGVTLFSWKCHIWQCNISTEKVPSQKLGLRQIEWMGAKWSDGKKRSFATTTLSFWKLSFSMRISYK